MTNTVAVNGKALFNFGEALEFIKNWKKVARQGWNGKNMYLVLQPVELSPIEIKGEWLKVLPYIAMRTADECYVPWLASQTDILAEDWVLLN